MSVGCDMRRLPVGGREAVFCHAESGLCWAMLPDHARFVPDAQTMGTLIDELVRPSDFRGAMSWAGLLNFDNADIREACSELISREYERDAGNVALWPVAPMFTVTGNVSRVMGTAQMRRIACEVMARCLLTVNELDLTDNPFVFYHGDASTDDGGPHFMVIGLGI